MQISAINSQNYKLYKQNSIGFKAVQVKKIPLAAGTFSRETSRTLSDILSAYKDIRKKMASLTKEGLDYLKANYPNIEIGEGLTFHNCGENNSSILIRCAESMDYEGLSRIIEKKGSSTWAERIVLNSFLLDGTTKALVNNDPNKQKYYPKEREYLTQEQINEQKLEESLSGVLEKLDFAMLRLRLFLTKVEEKYKTIPEGSISEQTQSLIRQVSGLENQLDEMLEGLPKKLRNEVRRTYPNMKLVSGLSSFSFQNLGEEKVGITYTNINPRGTENWRRLNIFDGKDNVINSFVVTDKGQMIANLTKNDSTHMPRKIRFANANEIKYQELEPDFEHYLRLYKDELLGLINHIKTYSPKRIVKMEKTPVELEENIQNDIQEILDTMLRISSQLKVLSPNQAADIKKLVPDLFAPPGRRGITFDGFQDGKMVYFLPITSKKVDGYLRLTITNPKGFDKSYLIKDNKFLVKNYNPQRPLSIPVVPKFWSEADDEYDDIILEALRYMKEKVNNYENIVQEQVSLISQNKYQRAKKIEKKHAEPKETTRKLKPLLQVNEISSRRDLISSIKSFARKAGSRLNSTQQDFDTWISAIEKELEKYKQRKI